MNFLIYVSCGMIYGAIITFRYFMAFESPDYQKQIMLSRNLVYGEYNNHTNTAAAEDTMMENYHHSLLYSHYLHHDVLQQQHHPSNPLDPQHQRNHYQPSNHKHIPHFRHSQVKHLLPNIPTPNERMPICFAFMMCLAVGIAVSCLLGFHLYLVCTSQTTIEFHGNLQKSRIAKENGEEPWRNPYDFGWKRNIEQIWGKIEVGGGSGSCTLFSSSSGCLTTSSISSSFQRYRMGGRVLLMIYRLRQIGAFALLLLPSWREPEYLPVPFHEESIGRRRKVHNGKRRSLSEQQNYYASVNTFHDENIV